uniref:Putative secreted protein n=1 Tax=Anopheles marajoara TaxID=58244 RepID=A0A2M4CC13_9DIPT
MRVRARPPFSCSLSCWSLSLPFFHRHQATHLKSHGSGGGSSASRVHHLFVPFTSHSVDGTTTLCSLERRARARAGWNF